MVFINFLNLSSIYLREKSRIDRLQIKQEGIFLWQTKRRLTKMPRLQK